MYINFKKLHKNKLDLDQVLFLCAVQQKEPQEVQDLYFKEEYLEQGLEQGLLKKLKKGEIRIDTKGTKLLKDLSSSGNISENTEIIVDWLIKVYRSRNGGVKNKKETQRRCQWFSDETGIDGNHLAVLLRCFIADTYNSDCGMSIEEAKKENSRLQLSVLTDNIFWNPPNHFARNYTLDNSPLWNYFDDYTDFIKEQWKKAGLD